MSFLFLFSLHRIVIRSPKTCYIQISMLLAREYSGICLMVFVCLLIAQPECYEIHSEVVLFFGASEGDSKVLRVVVNSGRRIEHFRDLTLSPTRRFWILTRR